MYIGIMAVNTEMLTACANAEERKTTIRNSKFHNKKFMQSVRSSLSSLSLRRSQQQKKVGVDPAFTRSETIRTYASSISTTKTFVNRSNSKNTKDHFKNIKGSVELVLDSLGNNENKYYRPRQERYVKTMQQGSSDSSSKTYKQSSFKNLKGSGEMFNDIVKATNDGDMDRTSRLISKY